MTDRPSLLHCNYLSVKPSFVQAFGTWEKPEGSDAERVSSRRKEP